jgi:hypothetical protein
MVNRHLEKYFFKEGMLRLRPLEDPPFFLFHRHISHHSSGVGNTLQIADSATFYLSLILIYKATITSRF